jgi:hypothetical protein
MTSIAQNWVTCTVTLGKMAATAAAPDSAI